MFLNREFKSQAREEETKVMNRCLFFLFLIGVCGLPLLSTSAHALSPKSEAPSLAPSKFAQLRALKNQTQGGQVTSIDHIDFKFIVGDLEALLKTANQNQKEKKKRTWKREDMLDLLEKMADSRQPLPPSELDTYLERDKLGKETTNPSIIKNMLDSKDPKEQAIIRAVIAKMAREGKTAQDIVERFTSVLVKLAAKKFHPGFLESEGQYNIVSIEVSPKSEPLDQVFSMVVEAYYDQALQYAQISPNNDVKIGMTPSGIQTMLKLIRQGVKVNSTLMFPDAQITEQNELDAPQYVAVAEAYIQGLEDRVNDFLVQNGKLSEAKKAKALKKILSPIVSVDSEFMSRGGVLVHGKKKGEPLKSDGKEFTIDNADFAGKMPLEIAQAKLIYQIQQKIYNPGYRLPDELAGLKFTEKIEELSRRFKSLHDMGANPKRLFLASTGSKKEQEEFMRSLYGNAWEYAYVQELIADGSLATHPPATYKKFNDSGDASRFTIADRLKMAREVVTQVSRIPGLIDAVSRQLLKNGVEQFMKDHQSTLDLINRVIQESGETRPAGQATTGAVNPAA